MKIKPDNWKEMSKDTKFQFLIGERTHVCLCNPSLGESCDFCKDIPDIKEEDRNYHEEAIILALGYSRVSSKDDEYWMYMSFLKLDDPKTFNQSMRYYFIEGGYDFDGGYELYCKSIRQCDYYFHLRIKTENPNENGEDYVSAGLIDSLLHSFLNISEIPYQLLKKLISL